MAQRTRTNFKSTKDAVITTNGVGGITGAIHNDILEDVADSTVFIDDVLDEDDMSTDSSVYPPSQQSVKAYVDNNSGSSSGSNNEVQTSDGSGGLVASNVFIDESSGNITIGDGSLSGSSRSMTLSGSSTDLQFNYLTKGEGKHVWSGLGFNSQLQYLNGVIEFSAVNASAASDNQVKASNGTSLANDGRNLLLTAGNAYSTSNDNGGNVSIVAGDKDGTGEDGNISLLLASGSFGSGERVTFIANCTTAPSGTPTGGGVLYVESGALKYKGSSGTVTTLGAA